MTHEEAIEAAAEVIWKTWCTSPGGWAPSPEGPRFWSELVCAAESGRFPAHIGDAAILRAEAEAAITARDAGQVRLGERFSTGGNRKPVWVKA